MNVFDLMLQGFTFDETDTFFQFYDGILTHSFFFKIAKIVDLMLSSIYILYFIKMTRICNRERSLLCVFRAYAQYENF